jgi:hypothetical protein
MRRPQKIVMREALPFGQLWYDQTEDAGKFMRTNQN